MGPAERVQAISIARRYYLEGQSKIEIAAQHGLSRYKVARILETCLEQGLVRIEIDVDVAVDAGLSERLRQRFGLRHALVLTGPFADTPALREALGRSGAELLREMLSEEDVLGVAWGRTIDVLAQRVSELPHCSVVQMTGIAGSVQASSVDLVRRLASASGGPSFPIYAPLIVSDHETVLALQRQTDIRTAMSWWSNITVAVVAIGSWSEQGSQVHSVLTEEDRADLARLDIAFEICAIPFDHEGRPIETNLADRVVGIPRDLLLHIPQVLAVAGGEEKVAAIRGALRGGLVTSLVTDAVVARTLLEKTK